MNQREFWENNEKEAGEGIWDLEFELRGQLARQLRLGDRKSRTVIDDK